MSHLGIVGATGAVGRTMLSILEERQFPVTSLRLFASARSAGEKMSTHWGEVEVEDLRLADPAGVGIVLFSAGAERSKEFAPRFVEAGAVVVDNSSAFRMDRDVPLVVAGVNDRALEGSSRLIANPNCSTMTLMMAAGPLHHAAGLRSAVVTTYQSVSGSGRRGIDELDRQNHALRTDPVSLVLGGWEDPGAEVYARPIAFNVVPLAGGIGEGGYTDEEWKLVYESRKILDIPDLAVEPTCVRVPVMVGHGVVATLRFDRPLPAGEAEDLLRGASGVQLWTEAVPTPLDSVGIDEVLVGRVRQSMDNAGINLWAVGDNLRKGAALNAVQVAEQLI